MVSEQDFLPERRLDRTHLDAIEATLLQGLQQQGLPSEGVLVEVSQRAVVLTNMSTVLDRLDAEQRARSVYISKFVAASLAGLFDASLNYLWDETISELRRRVTGYDLSYFFDVAEQNPERRKRLRTEADLPMVSDADLIRAANEMGLVSDLGRMHLHYIRHMRNWASAAHPNQNQLTGLQVVGWLETCIVEVINLPMSTVVAEIRKLLANVKSSTIQQDEARRIGAFFEDLPLDQADSLVMGFFGIYTDLASSVSTRQNVRHLLPHLWPRIPDETRHQLGIRYGRLVANGDQEQAEAAQEFLDVVAGSAYIPEGLRAAQIDAELESLLAAHHGWDNFYNEGPAVRRVRELVGDPPDVPDEVGDRYVKTLVEVFLTNGSGVAHSADPEYVSLLGELTTQQARTALLSYRETAIASKLQSRLGREKRLELVDILRPKLVQQPWIELADAIADHPQPHQLRNDATIRQLERNLGIQ